MAELRVALLALHKALGDSERISYETTVGQIQSPSHFLQLFARDAWFAWLQPLPQLIVAMDEALEEKVPLTTANGGALVKQTRRLFVASEDGEGFAGHYYAALQRDPDVVMAHAEVAKLIKPPQTAHAIASMMSLCIGAKVCLGFEARAGKRRRLRLIFTR